MSGYRSLVAERASNRRAGLCTSGVSEPPVRPRGNTMSPKPDESYGSAFEKHYMMGIGSARAGAVSVNVARCHGWRQARHWRQCGVSVLMCFNYTPRRKKKTPSSTVCASHALLTLLEDFYRNTIMKSDEVDNTRLAGFLTHFATAVYRYAYISQIPKREWSHAGVQLLLAAE